MQLLIPYALVDTPECLQALSQLQLPHLNTLLRRLSLTTSHPGSADDLSLPHEKALARARGLAPEDGQIPLAALGLADSGGEPGEQAWAWITPAHWRVATNHIQMHDPAQLQLEDAESRALMDAMAPYFAQDGMTLSYLEPARWLASGEVLATLACASLDRAIGTDVRPWMPASADMRRLQNEMQMLLYTHPVNDARAERRLDGVNSFWISGSGRLGAPTPVDAAPIVSDGLRNAVLHEDWAAWSLAWRRIDETFCRDLLAGLDAGQPVRLVLCSNRHALEFAPGPGGWADRLQRRWSRPGLHSFVDKL